MQRGSTILQYLTVRPNVSFSDPATPDGKLWNSALKDITQSRGWSQLHWGPRLASEEMVDLLISKVTYLLEMHRYKQISHSHHT